MAVYFALFAFVAVDAALSSACSPFGRAPSGASGSGGCRRSMRSGWSRPRGRLLPRALAVSVGLTVGLPFLVMVLTSTSGSGRRHRLLLVIVGACAVADVQDEWRALRRLGPLISVWEVQRTAEVEPILHVSERGHRGTRVQLPGSRDAAVLRAVDSGAHPRAGRARRGSASVVGQVSSECAVHGTPAAAVCARCGRFACAACLGAEGLCTECLARPEVRLRPSPRRSARC